MKRKPVRGKRLRNTKNGKVSGGSGGSRKHAVADAPVSNTRSKPPINKPPSGMPSAAQLRRSGKLFEAFVKLQARLRSPEGCPWDREQTHDSLRKYLVEETYEVLDALDSGAPEKLQDELGDLLLQILFHADIAREAGKFDVADVIEHVHEKMVRRHPHVFGNVKASTSREVLTNWQQIKAEELRVAQRKSGAGQGDTASEQQRSILDEVSKKLPALLEAQQVSRRAAKIGFDWSDTEGVLAKCVEEVDEIREALAAKRDPELEGEVGDLLFSCVNLARRLGLDAEITLKKANRKFRQRFKEMEKLSFAEGNKLAAMSAQELDRLWRSAKRSADL